MKKLLFFSLVLCLFIAYGLQKPIYEDLQATILDFQKNLNCNGLFLPESGVKHTSATPLSQKISQQYMSSSHQSEVSVGRGVQIFAQNSFKQNSETPKKTFSHSEESVLIQGGRRSNPNSENTMPTKNLFYATQNHVGEVEFTIPSGVTLPAAVVDAANNLSGPQVEVLDAIAEEFLDSAMPPTDSTNSLNSPKTLKSNWSQSLNEANERYRSLFGVDAYNAWTSQAAKEALNDQP